MNSVALSVGTHFKNCLYILPYAAVRGKSNDFLDGKSVSNHREQVINNLRDNEIWVIEIIPIVVPRNCSRSV